MKHIPFLLAIMLLAQPLPAQPPGEFETQDREAAYAPLALSTSGEGRILPFKDGQMLWVGRAYCLLAEPDRGYVFTNWTRMNVFTYISFGLDASGDWVPQGTNVVRSPVEGGAIREPVLRFIMPPAEVIYADGFESLTQTTGWQANFVPAKRLGK
jgi:hypothetical protein